MRPRHRSGQFGEVLLGFPALQASVVDIHQPVGVAGAEDELTVEPVNLLEGQLVIQAGIADEAQQQLGEQGPGGA
jgi:hypothetical protein